MNELDTFKNHAIKTVEVFERQLSGIHDSQLNTGVINTVIVSYQGTKIEVRQMSQVWEEKGRITCQPYDKAFVPSLAKQLADMGYNAYAFSRDTVVVNIPPRCGEERQKICAYIRKLGENAKIAVRNARKKCKQKLGKDAEKEIQQITDKATELVDQIIDNKCKQLLK